ncbi:hypothetical protein [Pikeienuella sp. HZG-20]|uniref:hypothetical protein n=1 Tax=Paludibacillus litoralis TaxID=3133267 RepID=UPI0030EB3F73
MAPTVPGQIVMAPVVVHGFPKLRPFSSAMIGGGAMAVSAPTLARALSSPLAGVGTMGAGDPALDQRLSISMAGGAAMEAPAAALDQALAAAMAGGAAMGVAAPEAETGFAVSDLFANGEDGAWFDPFDAASMFLTSDGATLISGAADPVGKILDLSGGGSGLGAEAVGNADFSDGLSGWTGARSNETVTLESGRARATATASGAYGVAGVATGLTIGRTYQLRANTSGAEPKFFRVTTDAALSGVEPVNSTGATFSTTFVATAATHYIGVIGVADAPGDFVEIWSASIREELGSPARQATDGLRPTLGVTADAEKGSLPHLVNDGVDDSLTATLPDLGAAVTIGTATEAGVSILTAQTVGAGAYDVLAGARTYAHVVVDRALTVDETAGLQAYLELRAPTETAAEAPANTVLPAITGTVAQGETLTASTGTWTGDAPITFAYKWRRDGDVISGATAATYTIPIDAQPGEYSVDVTATNSSGSTTASSAAALLLETTALRGETMNFTAPGLGGESGDYTTADLLPMGLALNASTGAITGDMLSFSPPVSVDVTRGAVTRTISIACTALRDSPAPTKYVANVEVDGLTYDTTANTTTGANFLSTLKDKWADNGTVASPKFHKITFSGASIGTIYDSYAPAGAHPVRPHTVIVVEGGGKTFGFVNFKAPRGVLIVFDDWVMPNDGFAALGVADAWMATRRCKIGAWWADGAKSSSSGISGNATRVSNGGSCSFEATEMAGASGMIAVRDGSVYLVGCFGHHFVDDFIAGGANMPGGGSGESYLWEVGTTTIAALANRGRIHADGDQSQHTGATSSVYTREKYQSFNILDNIHYGSTGIRDNVLAAFESVNRVKGYFAAITGYEGGVFTSKDTIVDGLVIAPAPGQGSREAWISLRDLKPGETFLGSTALSNLLGSSSPIRSSDWSGVSVTGEKTYGIANKTEIEAAFPNIIGAVGGIPSEPSRSGYVPTEQAFVIHPKSVRSVYGSFFEPADGWAEYNIDPAALPFSADWGVAPAYSAPTAPTVSLDMDAKEVTLGGAAGDIVAWTLSTSSAAPSPQQVMQHADATGVSSAGGGSPADEIIDAGYYRFATGETSKVISLTVTPADGTTYYLRAVAETDTGRSAVTTDSEAVSPAPSSRVEPVWLDDNTYTASVSAGVEASLGSYVSDGSPILIGVGYRSAKQDADGYMTEATLGGVDVFSHIIAQGFNFAAHQEVFLIPSPAVGTLELKAKFGGDRNTTLVQAFKINNSNAGALTGDIQTAVNSSTASPVTGVKTAYDDSVMMTFFTRVKGLSYTVDSWTGGTQFPDAAGGDISDGTASYNETRMLCGSALVDKDDVGPSITLSDAGLTVVSDIELRSAP